MLDEDHGRGHNAQHAVAKTEGIVAEDDTVSLEELAQDAQTLALARELHHRLRDARFRALMGRLATLEASLLLFDLV